MKIIVLIVILILSSSAAANAASTTLNWKDNSGNEDGFTIERSDNGAPFGKIGAVKSDVKTYVDNTLATPPPANPPGKNTYCFRVVTFNAVGSAAPSNESCVDVLGIALATVPAPASELTLTPPAARKVAPAKAKSK